MLIDLLASDKSDLVPYNGKKFSHPGNRSLLPSFSQKSQELGLAIMKMVDDTNACLGKDEIIVLK